MGESKISKAELMVMMVDFLNSISDSYSIKEQKIAHDIFNEFFDYYLKYNRIGVAYKIKEMQRKLNSYEKI